MGGRKRKKFFSQAVSKVMEFAVRHQTSHSMPVGGKAIGKNRLLPVFLIHTFN